jgi:hypothetical protein
MASREQIERELAKHPKWRNQPIAFINGLIALWADVPAANLPEKVIQAAYSSSGRSPSDARLLMENADYREAFRGFWENPVCEHWEYESMSAEDLLTEQCLKRGLAVTTENLEKVWPAVKPKLSRGRQYDIAQRQATEAFAERRAQEARKKLRELLLQDFVDAFEAKHRRDGDIQSLRNIGRARERENARLASLTHEQLLEEAEVFSAKVAQKSEVKRLQNAPLSEVQKAVREQAQQPLQAPRQAYASTPGQQFKPLPPEYAPGKPWTVKTLEHAPDLRRLLRTYGADQINEAVALNKSRGIF